MTATLRIDSTDGVTVALHDLGGQGPDLLFCHPTGFHGMVWAPVAAHLGDVARCWAVDFRGHGDSTSPDTGGLDWRGMGDDVLTVIEHFAGNGNGPLFGVGHSMGGAGLVLAELARPGSFAGLWLYEPIVFPPFEGVRPATNPMATAARRRKALFPDKQAALANYAAKPPLGALHPDALEAYVEYGFRETADGGVELKCAPETEARIFEGGLGHGAFGRLGELACPLIVAAGGDGQPPAQVAPLVADAAPHGHLERFPQLSHFGPMEDPEAIAEFIRRDLDLG